MKYKIIIVRYGEIALKGKETRKRFENILISNIKNAFNMKDIINKITKEWGRIFIITTQIDDCLNVLQKIFGITSFSPALQTSGDIDSISKLSVKIAKEELNKKQSFAIRATRTGEHDFSSQDVAIKVGNEIVKATKASVDLINPDFKLFIEIRHNNAFLFSKKIQGTGGMPLGTQGNVLSLIDSPESILASWYLMRRGCKTVFAITKESYTNILKPFTENWFLKTDIFTLNSERNLFEVLSKIADEKNCVAITTGHTIFNNSQKVLSNIKLLKKHINLPILNPLIAMNEEQIYKKCSEIGL